MEYPGPQDGVAPPDTATPVGQLRYVIGDVAFEEYDPVEPGRGNYEAFSDLELQSLLALGGDSIPRAVGYAYLKLVGIAASQAIDWRSDDLALTMSKMPAELRALAQMWFDRADDADSRETGFFIADTGRPYGWCGCTPELAAPVFCGCNRVPSVI